MFDKNKVVLTVPVTGPSEERFYALHDTDRAVSFRVHGAAIELHEVAFQRQNSEDVLIAGVVARSSGVRQRCKVEYNFALQTGKLMLLGDGPEAGA